MPIVSIIVPTIRQPSFLARAIESIRAQTFTDLEIVVVDNRPGERRVVGNPVHRSWLSDTRVRVIEDGASRTAGAARNAGLSVARGEWITFLDDDDEYRPEKIGQQLRAAEESRLPVGLCQLLVHVPLRRRLRGPLCGNIMGDDLLLRFPGMPAVFHRRAPSVRFDQALNSGEDLHYFLRLLRHFGMQMAFNVPRPLVDVHVQPNGHVNLDATGARASVDAILREFDSRYTLEARRVFLLRAQLGCCKLQPGHLGEMFLASAKLAGARGFAEARLIVNAWLFKAPFARRWLVS
jgi:hypothetical protein